MQTKQQTIDELLNGLDTLRPVVLSNKTHEHDMRALLRRMLALLEHLQRTPCIDPDVYTRVQNLLSLLFDAEHGALLKQAHHTDDTTSLFHRFKQHAQERKTLIDAAQQDLPLALTTVRHGFDLLGKAPPDTNDLGTNFGQFKTCLREYLQHHHKLILEFNLLTSALKQSILAMDDVLSEVGADSPELKAAQDVLEQDLPSDPAQAQALLRKARSSILQAGNKLQHASQHVKQTLTTQVEKMNDLSRRLAHAEAQARNDPLTGLGNRRKLREFFSTLKTQTTTLFMLDIDHFKHINDQYGHDAGDAVLKKLGQILKIAVRSTDMVARLGGEEFCIVLPETHLAQGIALAEKIRQEVARTVFPTQHGNIEVRISLGVAERQANETIAAWLKRADEALYQAKQGGRNQVVSALPKASTHHQS